jgi:hypothetical protein
MGGWHEERMKAGWNSYESILLTLASGDLFLIAAA